MSKRPGSLLRPLLSAILSGGLALLAAGGPVAAQSQSAICRSIESELAALERGGSNPRAAREAQRYRAEVQRVSAYMANIGCGRQRFLIFGSSAPPECGPLSSRLRDAQARLAAAEAAGGDPRAGAQRRQDLISALQSYNCRGGGVARSQGGFLSRILGLGQADPRGSGSLEVLPDGDLDSGVVGDPAIESQGGGARGGPKAVCVRACDGYFFPLDVSTGRAHAEGDGLCQALCPGAPTSVFFMTLGGDIENAVGNDGQSYTALPTALSYRQKVVPGCACKGKTESWAALLKPAEELLDSGRRGDITVTPQQSLELSRPIIPGTRGKTAPAGQPLAATETKANSAAGIGKEHIDVTNEDGSKRQIRLIAPPLRPAQN